MMFSCQGCDAQLMTIGTEEEDEARGRYLGWRIFRGLSQIGEPLTATWCPGCVDRSRPRTPKKSSEFEGQLEFAWEEDGG